jgi:transposase-like protein
MARNLVQFQKGLSLTAFLAAYGSEDQCEQALIVMRWPDGFVCPRCQETRHSYSPARRHFQCSVCRLQTSVKAGTVFHKSTTPLTKWFLAIYLLTQSKNDVAALEMARQLGVKWDTAWLIKQKLMEVMRKRNEHYKLEGDVQIDDAYLGGEKPGKRGRGAGNKAPFVIAVATRDGKPTYTQLRCVEGFTKAALKAYAEANLAPGTLVLSDGLSCFDGVAEAGMEHLAINTGSGRPKDVRFKWVNTALGNIKSAITGTVRSCTPFHAKRYLAAYEYRFNRRLDLPTMIERLAKVAIHSLPTPYRSLADVRPRKPAEVPG